MQINKTITQLSVTSGNSRTPKDRLTSDLPSLVCLKKELVWHSQLPSLVSLGCMSPVCLLVTVLGSSVYMGIINSRLRQAGRELCKEVGGGSDSLGVWFCVNYLCTVRFPLESGRLWHYRVHCTHFSSRFQHGARHKVDAKWMFA